MVTRRKTGSATRASLNAPEPRGPLPIVSTYARMNQNSADPEHSSPSEGGSYIFKANAGTKMLMPESDGAGTNVMSQMRRRRSAKLGTAALLG